MCGGTPRKSQLGVADLGLKPIRSTGLGNGVHLHLHKRLATKINAATSDPNPKPQLLGSQGLETE